MRDLGRPIQFQRRADGVHVVGPWPRVVFVDVAFFEAGGVPVYFGDVTGGGQRMTLDCKNGIAVYEGRHVESRIWRGEFVSSAGRNPVSP